MGCLYGKRDLLIGTKNQGHYFFENDDIIHKLNPAGPQHAMIASLTGIADYIDALAEYHLSNPPNNLHERAIAVFEMIAQHEAILAQKIVDFLTTKRNVRLIGPATGVADHRVATFSFTMNKQKSAKIPPLTANECVGLSNGHFYARRLIEALGISDANDGVVRASLAHYTSEDDVEKLISVLDRIL